jgi:glycoprotein endo-alpha-1,2-mannosidase
MVLGSCSTLVRSISRRWFGICLPILLLASAAPAAAGPLVGAYYYPWYGTFSGGHDFTSTLRYRLNPQQSPAIGFYNNRVAATIASHIDQSHRANINYWAVSWWGPSSAEDSTLRNNILANPRASEMKYSIMYESTGRFGSDFNNGNFSNLIPDFRYLAQNYFNNPNYLKIQGRPVVYMYLTRAYFNTAAARTAAANLRSTMKTEFGYDPYIVGDDVFGGGNVDPQRASLWDAVTDYDVYGTALQSNGSTQTALNMLKQQFTNWKHDANAAGVGFVPSASPGFNDSATRSGHPAAERYLPGQAEGSLFDQMLQQATLPSVDPTAANMMMITSFNEWHEDTQIEPTNVAPATSLDTGSGTFAQGKNWTGYGNLYLDILSQRTAPEPNTMLVALVCVILRCTGRTRRCQPLRCFRPV